MKKILFVTPYNPENRNVGDKVYTWDILRALKYNDANYVHVVMFENDDTEISKANLAELVNDVTYIPFEYKTRIQMFLSRYPSSMKNRKTNRMIKAVTRILSEGNYDVVMINMLKLTYLINTIKRFPVKSIFISHNVEYQVSRSIYKHIANPILKLIYWQDYLKTFFYEKLYTPQFDAITTICDKDAETYHHNGWGNPYVIRPIVDVSSLYHKFLESRKIILCGSFTWLPKKINLNRVLNSSKISLLKQNNCRLDIVGRAEPAEIDKGNRIPGVLVTGPVEDVHTYYHDATVAIVPEMAGGGFKLKIAEAIQHHVPIVALEGSVTDFNMKPGVHYIEVHDFDELIETAVELIDDPKAREFLVNNATDLFKKTYSINAVSSDILDVL